ncbi:MAG: hypothetical protein E7281_00215 [Lachnospiraceae bacterium]|nr:hypothetical protein [Lachnospiraceae bacterium]
MKKMKKSILSVLLAALVLSVLPLGTSQTAHAASVAPGKTATYISKIDPFVVTGEVARYRLTRDGDYVCPTNSDYYAGLMYSSMTKNEKGNAVTGGGTGMGYIKMKPDQGFNNLSADKSLEGTDLDLACLEGMDDIVAAYLNSRVQESNPGYTADVLSYGFGYLSRELVIVDDNTAVTFNTHGSSDNNVFGFDSREEDYQFSTQGAVVTFKGESNYYIELTTGPGEWAVAKYFATADALPLIESLGFKLEKIEDKNLTAVNGLAPSPDMSGNWYLYNNGNIVNNYTGLYFDANCGWWYVQNGQVRFDYTGLVANEYGWWYVQNGTINFNYTGLVCDPYVGWWFVENGAINFNATGLVANEYGWWFVQNGTINFNYTGLVPNDYGWWYVENGAINFNYNGLAYDPYVGWWVVNNGAINFGYTGMIQNEYGWWFAVNGALDFNATGWACNEYGWWLYYNGTIAWNYTGWWDGYYCVNGHLA